MAIKENYEQSGIINLALSSGPFFWESASTSAFAVMRTNSPIPKLYFPNKKEKQEKLK